MNTAVLVASIKHINSNYTIVNSLSTWIYLKSVENNNNISKLIRSLDKEDREISKFLIKGNESLDFSFGVIVEEMVYSIYDYRYVCHCTDFTNSGIDTLYDIRDKYCYNNISLEVEDHTFHFNIYSEGRISLQYDSNKIDHIPEKIKILKLILKAIFIRDL